MIQSAVSSPASGHGKDKSKGKDSAVTKQLTKTKMCAFYLRGKCASQTCRYAHSFTELKAAPNLQKTKLCKAYMQGECSDENCTFAHGEGDLRVTEGIYKTQMCNFWERGYCKKGERCNHAHGLQDLRPMSAGSTPTSENSVCDTSNLRLQDGQTPLRERRNQLVLSEILDNARNLTPQPPTPIKAEQPLIVEPIKSVTEILSQALSPPAVPASPWQHGLLGHTLAMGTPSPSPAMFGDAHQQWLPDPVDMLVGPERRQCLPITPTAQRAPPVAHGYGPYNTAEIPYAVAPAPLPACTPEPPLAPAWEPILMAESPAPRCLEDSLEIPPESYPLTADIWDNSNLLNSSMVCEEQDLKEKLASLDAVVRNLSLDIENIATRSVRSKNQSFHI
mmetsp:Transcript_59574/g.141754  ORF Transcript_59574/g.141754 Transcript_59574/m.141754 type:complete len:391 (+) Transcript_59574:121-1293(+)|eukprot:CAMPEP_0178415878 /NCGR_PEP_ID=MMETSP0689_2-20121128/23776_1 /TAXON_ID=160604 /ORGANISM="Amphidinium massartii, Strain CS-259" /LENGTH=390 /DNA_ID=CAMNT_0020037207 /DNA_START=47 /DNA_END=1219 /DNA_ORIENTATION=-